MIRFTHNNFLTFAESDLAQWLERIAALEGYTVDELEYNFVDSNTLFTINKEYLNHDTYTDIVTFDYTENKAIKAEAYISCDALKENAKNIDKVLKVSVLGFCLMPFYTAWGLMTNLLRKRR